ncbi:MAG: hypothetical protein KJ964_12410 [Verrucomicrobia bacterium]|nr:hypothetical protein [Verrucomicrobiota bacterium]MBU1736011.1 hypothetical protein [Verrucomicrobiota bacterium]
MKQQRRKRWIERKKKAAHLAAKTKPKPAHAPTPAPAPAVAAGVPAAPIVPATAGVTVPAKA